MVVKAEEKAAYNKANNIDPNKPKVSSHVWTDH